MACNEYPITYWAMRDTGDIGDVFAIGNTGGSAVSWIVTYLCSFSYRSGLTLRCMAQTFPKIDTRAIAPDMPQAEIVGYLGSKAIST